MAKSQRKTTIAILREVLGPEGQQDIFAALVGRSRSWVRHTSSGILPLTREAAYQIAFATGVSPEWLLRGDVTRPPVTSEDCRPYDWAAFQNHQTRKKSTFPELADPLADAGTKAIPETLIKILSTIHASGGTPMQLCRTLEHLVGFTADFEARFSVPNDVTGAGSIRRREAAFIRLVLRSTLNLLKRPKTPKKSAPSPDSVSNPE